MHSGFRPARHFLSGFFAGVHHSPDTPVLAIYSFGIGLSILIARIFITPIGNPKRAIRPDLLAHWSKPTVARGQKIVFGQRFEAGAIRDEAILINGILMDVAHENV